MILHTTGSAFRDQIQSRLDRHKIAYIIQDVTDSKINIFFGARPCIDLLKSFPHLNLRNLTPEQDFILGTMLGYDIMIQCRRYLNFPVSVTQEKREYALKV